MATRRLLTALGIGIVWSSSLTLTGCGDDTTAPADSGTDVTTSDVNTKPDVVAADVTMPIEAEGPDVATTPDASDGAAVPLDAGADASDASDSSKADAKPSDGGLDGSDAAADSDAGDAGTLYTRLGGHAGIRAAIHQIVVKELADPQILTYFYAQVANPVPASSPTASEIEECFTDLLANISGGSEAYPTTVSTVVFADGGVDSVTDAGGLPLTDAGHATWTCRDMTTVHAHLHISGGTFDKFVMIAGAELAMLGVAPADITTIATALVGTKGAIEDPALADAGPQVYPGPDGGVVDAAGE
jgi:hypothetical protein